MVFVFKANGDAMAGEGPEFFFQPVVEFFFPFAGEEIHDFLAAVEEFVAIPPFRIGSIGQGDAYRVLCIPGVFGHLYFLKRGFMGEGREGRFLFHMIIFTGALFAGGAKVVSRGDTAWWISGLLWYF